jgi:hypothetical protein
MLVQIESQKEKIAAFKRFEAILQSVWQKPERRQITWRPSSREMSIHHNGKYWFGTVPPNPKDTTPRLWNPFGAYHEVGNLRIAVEINIPIASQSKLVSGFFAKDMATGVIYLMHDGGVGGGKKGVNRNNFLAWSSARPVSVSDTRGDVRLGIIVSALDSHNLADDVARFVQQVLAYKEAVEEGETDTLEIRNAERTYKDYYDEYAGKKRRRRLAELEYVSRHGDIVRALHDWRRLSSGQQRIVKNAYIDLGIESNGILTELYEVKTSCERQSLYTALGQMIVHDASEAGSCRRFVVLPSDDAIPVDIVGAFKRAGVGVLRFKLTARKVRILGRGPE